MVFESEAPGRSTTPQGTPIHPGIFGQYKLALEEKEDIRYGTMGLDLGRVG